MPKRLAKSRERRKKPPQNAKGVKWFGATTATKESPPPPHFFFRRDVTVFPIDAQKWTACFRRFFRLCARVSSKRHKRNNACGTPTCPNATADVEIFETRISNDHERRDRRIGRPRGVVVARGRRAKGTNDDGRCSFWMMMMMMMMMGSTSSPPAIRDGGCLSFFSLSLSLSFSLSSKAKTNERRDAKSRRHSLARALFSSSSSSSSHSSMVCCLPPLLCFFFCLKHKTNTGPNLRRVRNVSRGHGSLENAPRDGRVPGR